MDEEGIFRLCGSLLQIEKLKSQIFLDSSDFPDKQLEEADPHVVTGLLKLFFRELPMPLIKLVLSFCFSLTLGREEVEEFFLAATNDHVEVQKQEVYTILSHALNRLTNDEYELLRSLCLLLNEVASHSMRVRKFL